MRWITLLLFVMLAAVQAELWFGKTSLPQVTSLAKKLHAQRLVNDQAEARNARTAAEVRDLKDGEEMVEEKARAELGMVKNNEILVRLSERATADRATAERAATERAPDAATVPRSASQPTAQR
jgi:cell division protein FtsB